MRRTITVWIGLASVLCVAGWIVWSNERILAHGQVVRLELAPADPRSLTQGDYMTLNYALVNALRLAQARDDGFAVVRLDSRRVATLVRIQSGSNFARSTGEPQAANEVALHFRVRNHRLKIATNAFFFQEGRGLEFRDARYGEFRVGSNGEPRLTALLDGEFNRLGENRY